MAHGDITVSFRATLSLLDYRLNGLTVNDVMHRARDLVENKLPVKLERCSASIFKRVIDVFDLKKEFWSLAKEANISEEVRADFIKKRVSELLRNANKWVKIFETEEEDRTNKKHRKHIKEMLPYLNEIIKMSHLFEQNENQSFAKTDPSLIRAKFKKLPSKKNFTKDVKKYIFLTKDIFIT